MKTYYIRHTKKLDIDNITRVHLWKNRKIAIHFPEYKDGKIDKNKKDNDSLDPNDYSGAGKGAMRTLRELANDGGYVCTQYFIPDKDDYECLVGYINPNSKIEFIKGTWGDLKGCRGKTAILKALSLQKVKSIEPSKQISLLIGRPQQGTIGRWKKAGEKVKNLVEGIKKSNPSLDDLLPPQQETLCSEFMRLPETEINFPGLLRLSHLLLPIGRNMEDVDIYGISADGKKIFAQVTYSNLEEPKVKDKCKKLSKYSDKGKNHLVFFCDTKEPKKDEEGIRIFPIQRVFDHFISTKAGKEWLQYSL